MPETGFLNEQQALTCIHCGLCLGACPTYLETGDENDSPRGRIYLMRALQAGHLPLAETAVTHLDRCLGCRACEAACPSGVPYGALLEDSRQHIETHHRRSLGQRLLRRWAIEQVFPYPSRLKLALIPVRLVRALGAAWLLPARLRAMLDLVPGSLPDVDLPQVSPATATPRRGRVGLIRGCVQSVMFGETNAATVRLLNAAGYDVVTPPDQSCCGALHLHGGQRSQAQERARHNVEVFARAEVDAIVINAAGCGSTLKEYGHLLGDEPAGAFGARVRDLSEILAPALETLRLRRSEGVKVTYHDACHLAHAQRITEPPRALVRAVAGADFVELPESDICCGSAGSYNLTEPELAGALQQRKTRHILASGAEIVVTSNPGCLLQIRAGLDAAGARQVRVLHLADYLASQLID